MVLDFIPAKSHESGCAWAEGGSFREMHYAIVLHSHFAHTQQNRFNNFGLGFV